MPYQKTNGQLTRNVDVTLASASVVTATGTTTAVEIGDKGTLRLLLTTASVTGTSPTLDVAVQTSYDGSTGWTTVASFAQKTTATTERKQFTGIDRFVRLSYTVGGTTPSFTVTVAGEAV